VKASKKGSLTIFSKETKLEKSNQWFFASFSEFEDAMITLFSCLNNVFL